MAEEKKVEYLELIYDLIFVYLIGRNNSLIHTLHDGFIDKQMFATYVICTLAVIQIWSYSTFYINRYGRNGLRDHIFIFINMYLLYYMANGTRAGWEKFYDQYNAAWALILINIGLQHFIERRNHKSAPWEIAQLDSSMVIVWIEAAVVILSIPTYHIFGVTLAIPAILIGIVGTIVSGQINMLVPVDFEHLTERIMLYVVFTFGEMVIAIAAYFEGRFSVGTIYFSVMGFLIVVGLFLSYGLLYDRIIDREKITHGSGYMMIHVFIIFALNNITVALELMREEEAELLPKVLFLTGSLLLYYFFLFLLGRYAKNSCKPDRTFIGAMCAGAVSFAVMMCLLRKLMYVNIFVTVVYAFLVFLVLCFGAAKQRER